MKKYYYKTEGLGFMIQCIEDCKLYPETKIGSAVCTSCPKCHSFGRDWIKCKSKKAMK